MKPLTAYDVAVAAVDWIDARSARVQARRERNAAYAKAMEETEDVDASQAASADEHVAYQSAIRHESATKNRLRAAVARAKKEMHA